MQLCSMLIASYKKTNPHQNNLQISNRILKDNYYKDQEEKSILSLHPSSPMKQETNISS